MAPPPQWKKKATVPKKTTSTLDSWAKKSTVPKVSRTSSTPSTSTARDSSPDIVFIPTPRATVQPSTVVVNSTVTPAVPVPSPKSSGQRSGGRKNEEYTSHVLLKELGADLSSPMSIAHPISEITRHYERLLIERCVAHNCAIGLHTQTSPAHVAAVLMYNFMRWFPKGRCVFLCSTNEHLEAFRERCVAVGVASTQITIIESALQFRKMNDRDCGQVLIATPQVFLKICESPSELMSHIRLLFIQFEHERETSTRYKKILTVFGVKNIVCRVVVHCPKLPYAIQKTSAITVRQSTITNLGLSEWIEFGPNDDLYRVHGVSQRFSPVFWSEDEIDEETKRWREKWREACSSLLVELSQMITVPSTVPDELFYVTWELIIKYSTSVSAQCLSRCADTIFCCEAYRNLTLHGPRAFFLYINDALTDPSPSSRAFELQTLIASKKGLQEVYYEVQKKYQYACASPYDVTHKELSVHSSPKWEKLRSMVQKYAVGGRLIRGLVLCESAVCSRTAAEVLNGIDGMKVVHAVLNDRVINDEKLRPLHKSSNALNGLFYPSASTVLILRIDLPLAYQSIDSMCTVGLNFVVSTDRRSVCLLRTHSNDYIGLLSESYETLRPDDGRQAEDFALAVPHKSDKTSIVDRYEFDFPPSRLCLDVDSMPMREYFRATVRGRAEIVIDGEGAGTSVGGFELNLAELAEYERRTGGAPLPSRDTTSLRCAPLTDDQLFWNEELQNALGLTGCSTLSERFVRTMQKGTVLLKRKRKYEYMEDEGVKRALTQIDSLIRQLEKVYTISN